MWLPAIVIAAVGTVQAAAPASIDACRLLTSAEIAEVQKVAFKETKASERSGRGQRHATCVFATEDVVHSVSLTVTTELDQADTLNGYWNRTFRRDLEAKPATRGEAGGSGPALRRIEGLGRDAVWTGDSKAGSLYVLAPGGILRVSVGGIADVSERLRRSQQLATMALARLPGGGASFPQAE